MIHRKSSCHHVPDTRSRMYENSKEFQLRRNHATVSSPRFSLPLPHAPHSDPILLQVSSLLREKVGASRDRQRGILTFNFDSSTASTSFFWFFVGQGGSADKKENHSREKFYDFPAKSNKSAPIYSILLYVHIQARGVRALFNVFRSVICSHHSDVRRYTREWN